MGCKNGSCKAKKQAKQYIQQVTQPPQQQAQQPLQNQLSKFSPIQQPWQQQKEQRQNMGTGQKIKQGLRNFFIGSRPEYEMLKNYAPEQENALLQMLMMGLHNQQNPYEGWEPIEKDIWNSFFSDIVPRLQTQFSASGNNSISSPVFQGITGQAAGDMSSRLAALRSQYGMQNKQFGFNQANTGLSPLYGNAQYRPGTQGLLPQIALNAIPGVGNLAGGFAKSAIQRMIGG